jgi:hypothetical protein
MTQYIAGELLGRVGNCAPTRQVCEQIGLVVPSRGTVLTVGESGTGKELVARALHQLSPRKDGPFVALNCAPAREPGASADADLRQRGPPLRVFIVEDYPDAGEIRRRFFERPDAFRLITRLDDKRLECGSPSSKGSETGNG